MNHKWMNHHHLLLYQFRLASSYAIIPRDGDHGGGGKNGQKYRPQCAEECCWPTIIPKKDQGNIQHRDKETPPFGTSGAASAVVDSKPVRASVMG